MASVKQTIAIGLIALITGCYMDVKRIKCSGRVTDAEGNPVNMARVSVICWQYGDSPDGSYTKSDTAIVYTNDKGEFLCKFYKGVFLEVHTDKYGYQQKSEGVNVVYKDVTVDMTLSRSNTKK